MPKKHNYTINKLHSLLCQGQIFSKHIWRQSNHTAIADNVIYFYEVSLQYLADFLAGHYLLLFSFIKAISVKADSFSLDAGWAGRELDYHEAGFAGNFLFLIYSHGITNQIVWKGPLR